MDCHPHSHRVPLRKPAGDVAVAPPALEPPPARLSNTFGAAEHPGALPAWTGGQKRERPARVTGLLSAWALGQEISAELRLILPDAICRHSSPLIP